MIDLYYWTTPNGHKITIFLEETGLPYTIKPVNISKGEQFDPAFLTISPNNRIPAIVDHAPPDGGAPLSLFESGAILLYLAGKTGRFYPARPARPLRVPAVALLADGQPRADGRPEPSLRALRAGEDSVRDRPLRQGNGASVRGARTSASPIASSSPANTGSPTWRAIRGFRRSARARTSTSFRISSAGWRQSGAAGGASAPTQLGTRVNAKPGSERRAGAQDPVRPGSVGREVARRRLAPGAPLEAQVYPGILHLPEPQSRVQVLRAVGLVHVQLHRHAIRGRRRHRFAQQARADA